MKGYGSEIITSGKTSWISRIFTQKAKRRSVVVDMGAIKFVSEGADIMCPGIIDADQEIQKGDLVIISDEVHNKPLAIGKAIISGEEMMGEKGKAVKSLHHVGDKLWNLKL